MTEPARCPKCHAELPANAPQGLCPQCLLQAAFDSQSAAAADPATDPTRLASSGFVPPTPAALGRLFPQLEILELLGRGGMGAVYKARQKGLDRLVAVKVLPPEVRNDPAFAERFTREAKALARLNHPFIVTIHDVGQADGLYFFVMEFVDGLNLRQLIERRELSSEQALAIVPQICEALQYAHDEGIVHRDIKPENILLDKRGRVKIADFGLAKLLGHESVDGSLTGTQQVMGTLRYMAPEQMRGARQVDHRADIYSLGVVFYELLTGELPIGRFAPPSRKVQIDVRLDEIVLRALEAEPEQRYQHASEVKTDMDAISRSPGVARPESVTGAATPSQPATADQLASSMAGEIERRKRLAAVPAIFLLGAFLTLVGVGGVAERIEEFGDNPWRWLKTLHDRPFTFIFLLAGTLMLLKAGAQYLRERKPSTSGAADPESTKSSHRHDAGTPVTQIRFVVNDSRDVARQAIFHFSTLGYRLLEQRPDVCVFQRGRKWAGLWETDIRALHTILTVRTAPAADGELWVSCDWSIRMWGSWISRRDIAKLEVEGRGLESLLGGPTQPKTSASPHEIQPGPEHVASDPRFSRFAILGAVWALFGVLAVIPTLLFIGLSRVWNGTALPTDLIYEKPPLAFTIFMGALLAMGAGAPIGTTIFGALSIGHIKRSGGRIVGLPLAVVDLLFFPLLALFAGIALPVSLALHALLPLQMIAVAIPSAMLALVVCLVIGFAVWRKVIPDSALSAITLREKLRLAGIALLIAGIMDAFGGLVWIGHNVSVLMELLKQGAPIGWQVAATCLSLGSLWIVYYVVGVALHLMTLEDDGDFTFCLVIAAIAPPGCLIGLPAAIYAFMQLTKPEVKALIPKKSSVPQSPTHPNEDRLEKAATDPISLPSTALPSKRPKLVPVLAAFNLVGAILLMLVCAMDEPAAFAESVPQIWLVWEKVDAVLGLTMAAGLFAASIGLFLWKGWARKVTLGVCVFGLASFVFDAPYLARFLLPDLYAEVQHTLAAEGIDPDARDFVAMTTVVILIGGLMVVGLTWLIGQLVYFTRPHVIAAFESPTEKQGKFIEWLFTGAGAVVGVLSVFGPLALLLGIAAFLHRLDEAQPVTRIAIPAPPLGTITSGLGAEFTVPAGHVAVFEIVTRRDNATVPIPPHCGYVMAPADTPVAGTFRWSRLPEEVVAGKWSLEIVTGGGSRGYTEGTLLPEELNSEVGARGIALGLLEPNAEAVHWGNADAKHLPANGLIGLRVTVMAHGLKAGGSGNAHIDWKKAQSAQSTTSRKLPSETP